MGRTVVITTNGVAAEVEVDPRNLLVDYIRDVLGLTGTHVGCDTSHCGACTVVMDGKTVKSCTVLAVQANGAELTTIEGIAGEHLHPVQQAFWDSHAFQCGYCTPGFIISTVSLLEETPSPSDEDVLRALEGNLCRCTGYVNIVRAVRMAAEQMATGEGAAASPDG